MRRRAVGVLVVCCALAGPFTIGSVGAAAQEAAFPRFVSVYVLPLDVRFNEASRNKVFCRRDANDPNQQEQVQPCETATTRVTLTLTAATAKAAGLAKREISSVVVPLNANDNFKHDLSRSEVRKLKKLKVVKLVVSMSVTYNGTTREAPPRKMTGGRGANGQALIIGLGERETEQGDAGRGR